MAKTPSLTEREAARKKSQSVIRNATAAVQNNQEEITPVEEDIKSKRGRPKKDEELKPVSVYLRPEQHKKLRIKAVYDDTDVSSLIRDLIDNNLDD